MPDETKLPIYVQHIDSVKDTITGTEWTINEILVFDPENTTLYTLSDNMIEITLLEFIEEGRPILPLAAR